MEGFAMGPDLSALRAYVERLIDEVASLKTAILEPGPLPSLDRADMAEHVTTIGASFFNLKAVLLRAERRAADRVRHVGA